MLPVGIEMKALTFCVHTGVSSPARLNLNRLINYLGERCLYVILHCAALRLSLPAVKVGAVVGADTFPSHRVNSAGFDGVVKSEVA